MTKKCYPSVNKAIAQKNAIIYQIITLKRYRKIVIIRYILVFWFYNHIESVRKLI